MIARVIRSSITTIVKKQERHNGGSLAGFVEVSHRRRFNGNQISR